MKKGFGLGLIIWLFMVVPVKAYEFSLFVSDEDLDFQVQQQVYTYSGSPLFLGGGILYSEKDNRSSWLLNAHLVVEDLYQKMINLGLGFEGVGGEVEPSQNYDIIALGFRFAGEVDLTKASTKLPLSFETNFFYAPPILSFSDTERVLILDFTIYFHLNATAFLGVGYKIINIDINKPGNPSWDNSTLMFGARILF